MQICCDICGGELVMMAGGKGAVCKNCGMEHSIQRVREMLNIPAQAPEGVKAIPAEERNVKKPQPQNNKRAVAGEQKSASPVEPIDVVYEVDDPKAARRALTESSESDFVLKKRFGGAKLVAYRGNAQRVVIPACVSEIPSPDLFAGHNEIVELVFPGGLSTPYAACFANCRNLKKVVIMGSAIMMDETFAGCASLEEVEIKDIESEDSPIILSDRAFADCTSLKSVYVDPRGRMELGRQCFENCVSLPSFRCTPMTGEFSGEYCIPHGCFKNCKNLREVIVPDDLERIEDAAFENCVKLRKLTYHNGTTPTGVQIQPGAFKNAGWNP